MGKIGDIGTVLLVGGLGVGAFLLFKGVSEFDPLGRLGEGWTDFWSKLFGWVPPTAAPPTDVTLVAGVDFPIITTTSVIDWSKFVPVEKYEAEVEARETLADMLSRARAGQVKLSGLTEIRISASERLAYDATRMGASDV